MSPRSPGRPTPSTPFGSSPSAREGRTSHPGGAVGAAGLAGRLTGRAQAVPAWCWLGAIVIASAAARAWVSRWMPAPFIFTDELTYAELARSFAESGSFAIRDVPVGGYGFVYPVLISPAFAVFDSLPDAYAAVKVINSAVMSLAAVPAYLIARRAVGAWSSLLVAALTVALPSLVYTSTVMTENVFYPVSLTCAWALLLVLERPTWARSAVLVALLGVALATRVQAVYLVAAALTAPPALALVAGGVRRLVDCFRLYALVLAAGLVVVAGQLARGGSPQSLLGAYAVVGDVGYDTGLALRYWVWHLEELTLLVGVVPVAALLVCLLRARRSPAAVQRHLAVTVVALLWVTLVVAVFASRHAGRIQERNMFYVAPLVFVALLVWVERREAGDRRLAVPAALLAGALPVLFPYPRFIDTPAMSDTLALLPIWSAFGSLPFGPVWQTVLLGAALAGVVFVLVPRRLALAVPVVLLGFLCVVSASVWSGERGFQRSGIGGLFQGIRSVPRDWIDASVPADARVAALYVGRRDPLSILENEFFNRAVGRVLYLGPRTGNVPEEQAVIGDDNVVRLVPSGRPLLARYLLAEDSVEINGRVLAKDAGTGVTLWAVAGPRVTTADVEITGLYDNDTWSGPEVLYRRRGCPGGSLTVSLGSDERLFGSTPTTVEAFAAGRRVAQVALIRFSAPATPTLRVPLESVNGSCEVRFRITPTLNPSQVLAGSTDDRELGAHFYGFAYEP